MYQVQVSFAQGKIIYFEDEIGEKLNTALYATLKHVAQMLVKERLSHFKGELAESDGVILFKITEKNVEIELSGFSERVTRELEAYLENVKPTIASFV